MSFSKFQDLGTPRVVERDVRGTDTLEAMKLREGKIEETTSLCGSILTRKMGNSVLGGDYKLSIGSRYFGIKNIFFLTDLRRQGWGAEREIPNVHSLVDSCMCPD